jgi:hypothetical protein
MNTTDRIIVDMLVNEFWRLGYFTLSRRFGTYLPEPADVGRFKVDIVGRQKDKYAIGIILNKDDFDNENLKDKLIYLSSRHTRFSNKPVMLLVGVPENYFKQAKDIINLINNDEIRKNIKAVRISENKNAADAKRNEKGPILFS